MKVIDIAFSGYSVTDLKRARKFYEDTLGLSASRVFGDETSAWVEYDIGPATLAITNGAPDWKPAAGGGSVALEVQDFPAAVQRLKETGTRFIVEPFDTPVCHFAAISDPDGNTITIHKRKS
jgi:predicted enzyme related to lactoylglutathione lyase